MLICQIKRIISSKKWINYVVPFFSFFFENGSVGLNGDEKEDGLNVVKKKKKSDDSVKPSFPWNNSFNLKNEHSNRIEKNRNIF